METIGTPQLWLGFTGFVLAMLALDLGVFHRTAHAIGVREALAWSVVWVTLALLFNAGVYAWFGTERALEFLTGYLIEKALSVDNIFVFAVLFSYFGVPPAYQHRVLFWGILSALVMRGAFILAGAALIQKFHWIMYIFGGFLIVTGVKLFQQQEEDVHPEKNPLFRLCKRVVPLVPSYQGAHFFVREAGRWYATPLFLVLLSVEVTDLIFAVDSIPAIFAVTSDPFIVYTSNIFAILGLRALYFLLAGVMGYFHYLKVGLALVLVFIGTKLLIADFYKIPISVSLIVVAALISGAIVVSLLYPRPVLQADEPAGPVAAEKTSILHD
ncbi:MAG: TerC family protein [Thermodesulfobacteriota bacterium]